jgi:hypothetical protein
MSRLSCPTSEHVPAARWRRFNPTIFSHLLSPLSSLLSPLSLFQDEFRALSWRRNWIFYVIGSWVLMILVTLTIVPKFRCMVEGKDFCDSEGPFTKVIASDFDVIPLALIGHFMDLAITLISVIFLTGPRVDCNLGHWVIERLPPSMSPTWLKDDEGNVKLSGVGEFWLYKVAVSSILVANQTFISARDPFYIDAGMTSIL